MDETIMMCSSRRRRRRKCWFSQLYLGGCLAIYGNGAINGRKKTAVVALVNAGGFPPPPTHPCQLAAVS